MIKALYRRLNHCNDLAVRISKANTAQLQQLKAELAELIGTPTGCYTMGIPAVLSTLGVIVSFGMPQLWLGYKVSAALGLPEESVFIWVVLIALLFSGINGMTMFLIGKGLMRALSIRCCSLPCTIVPGVNFCTRLVKRKTPPSLAGGCLLLFIPAQPDKLIRRRNDKQRQQRRCDHPANHRRGDPTHNF